ncbi:MAG: hypothetical protein LBC89_04840, partial [Bacteroidales bacterium]|nr:hypothetical protein [Bacteroidales bacterium]
YDTLPTFKRIYDNTFHKNVIGSTFLRIQDFDNSSETVWMIATEVNNYNCNLSSINEFHLSNDIFKIFSIYKDSVDLLVDISNASVFTAKDAVNAVVKGFVKGSEMMLKMMLMSEILDVFSIPEVNLDNTIPINDIADVPYDTFHDIHDTPTGVFQDLKLSNDTELSNDNINDTHVENSQPSFTGSGEEYCDGSMCWCTKFEAKGPGTPNYCKCGHPKSWHHKR